MAPCAIPTTRRADRTLPRSFEQLEPRLVFSAPFAGVGFRFDNGPSAFLAEGILDDSDDISGTIRLANLAGAAPGAPLEWSSLTRGDNGSFTFGAAPGFTPYASQTGTLFIADERRPFGSFVGRDADGETRDLAFLTQPRSFPVMQGVALDLNMTRITDSGELEAFRLLVILSSAPGGFTYDFTYMLSSGTVTESKIVTSVGNDRWTFDSGEVLIFAGVRSLDDSPVILADLDPADGILGIATGRVLSGQLPENSGRYRTAVMVDGPLGAEFFGLPPGSTSPDVANVVIELNYWSQDPDPVALPNTFSVYRQSDWDAGMRTPITQGTWLVSHPALSVPPFSTIPTIRLDADTGPRVTVQFSSSRVLLFSDISSDAPGEESLERLHGVGAAIAPRAGALQDVLVHTDPDARPVAYVQFGADSSDNSIYSVDLIDDVGGEAVTGELVTWRNGFQFSIAGRSASGDILLWRLHRDGVSWSFANLTDSIDGARPIASDLFSSGPARPLTNAFNDGAIQTLAGYDADGNFIAYTLPAQSDFIASSRWEFIDVELNAVGGAGSVPDVVGGLTGWTSGWGASHFAGIDADGELWVIWFAPGLSQWHVDSLTDNASLPALIPARPSALRTSWDTFHISAADTQGHLIMTWWAVGFDNWVYDDLTVEFSGPTLDAASITSGYNATAGTINVTGLDDQGDARIYWWAPNAGWRINSLSAAIPVEDVPRTPWTFTAATWGTTSVSQSLLGRNDNGDRVRLVWRSYTADIWLLENLTATSTPFIV